MADCCSSLVGSSPSVSVLMYEAARDTPHRMISRVRYDPANAVGKDASLKHLAKEEVYSLLAWGLPTPGGRRPWPTFLSSPGAHTILNSLIGSIVERSLATDQGPDECDEGSEHRTSETQPDLCAHALSTRGSTFAALHGTLSPDSFDN
jgi:hypothetical protein